jgi:hypothetical protein
MDTQALLAELLDLAEQLDIEVRRAWLGGDGGGLCRLRDKWVLFVDDAASLTDQLAQTAHVLADRKELEEKFLLPQIRQILEQYR